MTRTKEIVILIIAVAVVAVGWWWQKSSTPTTSEVLDTSNWLTYRNEKYGFELKYPPGYKIGPIVTGGPEKVQIGDSISVWDGKYSDTGPSIDIYLPTDLSDNSANPKAAGLSDYSRDYKAKYLDVIIHQQEERNINGFKALKQTYSAGRWVDSPGGKVFYARNEYEQDHWFRYVIFDGHERFIILRTWNPAARPNPSEESITKGRRHELFLDELATTFRFL